MMKKSILLTFSFILSTISFSLAGGETDEQGLKIANNGLQDLSGFYTKDNPDLDPFDPKIIYHRASISALRLFATEYNGKFVSVKGYLSEWAGTLIIYPTKADAEMENLAVGLMVETSKKTLRCKDNYVLIKSGFIYSEEQSELGFAPVNLIFTYDFEDSLAYSSGCYIREK